MTLTETALNLIKEGKVHEINALKDNNPDYEFEFISAKFEYLDLTDINLLGVKFTNCIFRFCNLYEAKFPTSIFKTCNFYFCDLELTDFSYGKLEECFFYMCDLSDIVAYKTETNKTGFEDCK